MNREFLSSLLLVACMFFVLMCLHDIFKKEMQIEEIKQIQIKGQVNPAGHSNAVRASKNGEIK